MRKTFPLLIAVALTAAAPAAAQGTDNTVNAAAAVAPTGNDTAATTDAVTNDMAMMSNDMAAAPATDQPVEATTEPAPAKPAGFPWGVLGLLGLVGLIGRKRG